MTLATDHQCNSINKLINSSNQNPQMGFSIYIIIQ
uniref:Uncharacterized protein n=1 Tax=Rhizophora mucronata TaxID=61149 RepID=A0A2P2PY29_RHIMU